MNERKPYLKILTSTLFISAFTFGGGYVIIPLLQKKFSEDLGWLDEEEMLELVAISQSSPGAIAINCATLIGYRVAGLPGALIAILGTATPPLIILMAVYFIYDLIRDNVYVAAVMRGMQAGIGAVVANAVTGMALPFFKRGKLPWLVLMLGAFAATWFFGVNVVFIILSCGIIGALAAVIRSKKAS